MASTGVVLLLLLALAARMALQPERSMPILLDRLGEALGLEITATGTPELRLRGNPALVVRDVTARQPGAARPVLHAERILLSLPWSTVRDRGATLDLVRVELDAPTLDLPALRRWLATRPPGETRIPTLRDGLRVRGGRIDDIGWRVENFDGELRDLHPGRPVQADVRGRYVDGATTMPFDLVLALSTPAPPADIRLVGTLELRRPDWRMPARVELSGPLRLEDGDLHLAPARLELSADYVSGDARLPFVLGLHGPLRYRDGTWVLAPVGVAMRGRSPLPVFDAHGALALGRRLVLRLDGTLPDWPEAWPTLPPPLGASTSALPFTLDYAGAANLSSAARLRLQRDGARFDARFRLPDVMAWLDDGGSGTPLPPLSGSVSAPHLEISGARLEGVEIVIEEPGLPAPDATQ
ncbi:MAG: hypothetical protein ACR2J7_08660 [Luteimonas sp.]